MCGIIGVIGDQNSVDIVVEGLKRLEYRGYDSSGVSFVSQNRPLLFKKKGKLDNLVPLLSHKPESKCAIGHTRWATHGQVNDTNAHPHVKGPLSLVHNGIIENAHHLKEHVAGYDFSSETDSEVFLAMVWLSLENGLPFEEAFLRAFQKTRGNSGFVMMHSESQEILAIKRKVPLVCGTNKSQVMVSSDPYALVDIAEKVYFPEDEVLCRLKENPLIGFFDTSLNPSKNYSTRNQKMRYALEDKGDFEHYMLKEIYEQPNLIRALPRYYFSGDGVRSLDRIQQHRPEKIFIVACGTAAYAGMVIRNFLEKTNRIPAEVDFGSEFRYREPVFSGNLLGCFISQSGETADTLAAQELCANNSVPTLGLINVEGSTLYRKNDHNLLIRAGVEIGVASTKAFTQMALTGHLLSFSWGQNYRSKNGRALLADRFNLLADRIEELVKNVATIQRIAYKIHNKKGYFYTGRGIYYPVALEGALKLKETTYVHAEGYASGELKHGPIALIDEEIVNIAIVGPQLREKSTSNVQEVKTRKGIIVGIGDERDQNLKSLCNYFIPLNYSGLDDLSPLYVNVANQLLAYYMAKFKGTDIDKPRNLAKSVTVE